MSDVDVACVSIPYSCRGTVGNFLLCGGGEFPHFISIISYHDSLGWSSSKDACLWEDVRYSAELYALNSSSVSEARQIVLLGFDESCGAECQARLLMISEEIVNFQMINGVYRPIRLALH